MSRTPVRCCLLAALLLSGPAVSQAETTFAVVGGLSGQFEQIGTWFKKGAQGAVEEINGAGGLLGEKVNFIARDDGCDPTKAEQIAEELVQEGIRFVMGHLCSDASIAASTVYEKNGIIAISPASTNPLYTERNLRNVFRTIGRDDMQGFVIAEHILRNYKTKRVGILYDETTYSRGVAEVLKGFLNQAGVEEQFFKDAPQEPYDFADILDLIEKTQTAVIVYPALPDQLASFLHQLDERGLKLRLIGGDTYTNLVLDEEDLPLLDGIQFSFPPDPADDLKNQAKVEKYKAEGFNPEAFTFYSYAAVQVWAQAVEKAGTLEAGRVSEELKSGKFDTVLGEISFDGKGDISNPGFVIFYYSKGNKYYFE